MPLYEYECTKCHNRFERLQRFSDPPVSVCPECGAPVSQLVSAPAIQFKGSGWYVTDYAHKHSSPAPTNGHNGHNGGGSSDAPSTPPSAAASTTTATAEKK
ncbi:MAG TPA: FmdB family zinc ribbon protein [Armatimonadota bacterium]|nr:FmdB family zinc ribbon protein [Armatimonadota bacterium]